MTANNARKSPVLLYFYFRWMESLPLRPFRFPPRGHEWSWGTRVILGDTKTNNCSFPLRKPKSASRANIQKLTSQYTLQQINLVHPNKQQNQRPARTKPRKRRTKPGTSRNNANAKQKQKGRGRATETNTTKNNTEKTKQTRQTQTSAGREARHGEQDNAHSTF